MDANQARDIEKNIIKFIEEHFQVEGRNFYEKLQSLGYASRVKDIIKKSLLNELHDLKNLRNDAIHQEDQLLLDLYDRVWEKLLRLAVPDGVNMPFLIINKHSGYYLDAPWEFGNGRVRQWTGHRGKNQHWLLRKTIGDDVIIISALSGKCLDLEGHSHEMPAWFQVWNYHGGENQKFVLNQLNDGSYSITVKHSGLVLDVYGASVEDGALITQWEWHGGDCQRWYINPAV